MIENITRYIEEGERPLQAALKGSEQNRIHHRIAHGFIDCGAHSSALSMGDIVGRLFRQFAVTLSVTILVSAIVSLTLTPMMCSRLLKYSPEGQRGRFYKYSEHLWQRIIDFYGKTLQVVLQHQTLDSVRRRGYPRADHLALGIVPKGFFPVQDTGIIQGIWEAPQTISFPAMAAKQQELARVILKDPAVRASLPSLASTARTSH